MKEENIYHLCLTHSPLVTMIFQAAVKQLGIPPGQVGSISRRSVKPAGQGLCLDDLSNQLEAAYKEFARSRYAKLKSELRNRVSEITRGHRFIAYVPHTQRILFQEVITHPDCAAYQFIEEGFTAMAWNSHQGVRTSRVKWLRGCLRAWWTGSSYRSGRDMFDITDARFRGAISISKNAFAGMPGVRDVSGSVARYTRRGLPARLFVVLDTSYLHRGIRWEDYENALVASILEASPSVAEIIVKFHFVDDSVSARYASLSARVTAGGGGPMSRVDRDFSVEEQLSADDHLLFAVSSLGYYVALFGGSVKCFAPAIIGLDLDQWIRKNALPPDFRQMVGLIESSHNYQRD